MEIQSAYNQSAFNVGVDGFNKATDDANKAAANIVAQTTFSANESGIGSSADTSTNDTTSETSAQNPSNISSLTDAPSINQSIVDLKVAEFQAKASAEVIKTADETLGTLLDVRV